MELIQRLATKSDCFRAGRTIKVKGLMIHSVGCSQPSAGVFADRWNKPGVSACAHAVLQPDGRVYQCLPWDHRGWHAGAPVKKDGISANNTHIGVEMTEPITITYLQGANFLDRDPVRTEAHVRASYAVAVELFAKLCADFGLDPLKPGVVVSHNEGCKLNIASNHSDPEHLWGRFGLTMDGFRAAVKTRISEQSGSTF